MFSGAGLVEVKYFKCISDIMIKLIINSLLVLNYLSTVGTNLGHNVK